MITPTRGGAVSEFRALVTRKNLERGRRGATEKGEGGAAGEQNFCIILRFLRFPAVQRHI